MRRLGLAITLYICACATALAQVNPLPGSVWTYQGPSLDPKWQLPSAVVPTSTPFVTNNGALTVLAAPAGGANQQVYRQGFATAGDGGGALYTYSSSACSLNAGAGDNGYQVKAANNNCWIADFTVTEPTPLVWGAKGDGTTNDTTTVQAAWNGATAAGVPLHLGNHLYKISAISYTVGAPASILGKMVSYTGGFEPSLACTSGFVAAAPNLTMITVGHDAVLQDFCIKAGNAGVNTSGVAINMESVCDSSAACPQSYNNLVNRVVIDRAFLGIALSGQFHNITNNLIENIQPGGGGIRIGEKTNSNRSVQPNLYNNNVFGEFGGSAQYALLIKDAGGPYVTNNELNSTTYNYWINPGLDTSGGNGGQNVQAIHSTGNYADNAITNNFRVDCQAGSFGLTNGGSSFVGDWFTGVPTGPGDNVWIGTTGYAASGCKVFGLTMTQVQIYGAKGHGINVSGPGVWSLSVNNSHICGNGAESGKSGIYLASDTATTVNGFTFVGNTIGGSCDGRDVVQPVGITLNGNKVMIVGNDLSQGNTTPISGVPVAGGLVINNLGADDHITNNEALKAAVPARGGNLQVYRQGFYSAGDGGGALYQYDGNPCPINGGLGDDGSQVKSGNNKCWRAVLYDIKPTPLIWGARGDGTTNDTTTVQAALSASAGGTLYFDAAHKYLLTTGLTSNQPVNIVGPYPGGMSVYSTSCPSGIIVNTDLIAITLTGITGSVQGMCIQMATASGTRTSGAGIKAGSMVGLTPAIGQGRVLIQGNTIINPYDGILVGGDTTGGSTPSQTNSNIIDGNAILWVSNRGIAIGSQSLGVSTNGTTLDRNQILCQGNASIGVALYDGAVTYRAGDSGPYGCDVGTKIYPGTGQEALGEFSGVMGDTVRSHALLIDASGTGLAKLMRFTGWWASTGPSTIAGGSAVTVRNTSGNAGRVAGIVFTGGITHGCSASGLNTVQLLNDVYDIVLNDNKVMADCSQTNDTGILINTTGLGGTAKILISSNSFVPHPGGSACFAKGIWVTGTGDGINITNNYFGEGICNVSGDFGITESIVWTTGTGTRAVITGNLGLDTSTPSVANAAAITAPKTKGFVLTGAGSVSTMAGMWQGRQVTIVADTTGAILAAGGGTGKFCTATTLTAWVPVTAYWSTGFSNCWAVK